MEYTGRNNQTTIDVALQTCGSMEAVYAMAMKNNVEITEYVQGRVLTYDESDVVDGDVVAMLKVDDIELSGKVRTEQVTQGLGYWRIG